MSDHFLVRSSKFTVHLIHCLTHIALYVLCKHPSQKGSGQSILTLKSHPLSWHLPVSWGLSCTAIWSLVPSMTSSILLIFSLLLTLVMSKQLHFILPSVQSVLSPSESAPSLGLQLFLHVHLCHTTVLSLFIVSLVWETGDFLRSLEQTPLLLNFHDKSVLCTKEGQRAQLSWPGEIISRLKKTIII